jgi:hypothetical protein
LFVLIFFVVYKKEMCGICMEKKIKILHFFYYNHAMCGVALLIVINCV